MIKPERRSNEEKFFKLDDKAINRTSKKRVQRDSIDMQIANDNKTILSIPHDVSASELAEMLEEYEYEL
jgi:hypothetical protein